MVHGIQPTAAPNPAGSVASPTEERGEPWAWREGLAKARASQEGSRLASGALGMKAEKSRPGLRGW